MRFASIALFVALLSWIPAQALGQEDEATARSHFEAARSHFERGAYEEAQREFQAAYELSRHPELLYNLYLVAERLGDLDTAIAHLERYLAEGEIDEEVRAPLEARLQSLEARRQRMGAGSPETSPEASEAEQPAAAQDGDLLPAVIALGVAGAGLVSFAITGGLALAENDALANGCGVNGSCTDEEVSTLAALNLAADVSWVTAAVAAVAGAVLFVTLGLPSESTDDDGAIVSSIAPWITPDGGLGLALEGRF